ncbi:hypothetical protein BGZ49_001224, partial [Haplosporangium sp. Z 27]
FYPDDTLKVITSAPYPSIISISQNYAQLLGISANLEELSHRILAQNFELQEYSIPGLFIILPVVKSNWNSTAIL